MPSFCGGIEQAWKKTVDLPVCAVKLVLSPVKTPPATVPAGQQKRLFVFFRASRE